jgi:TRAP-type C4-dicarboxylate transport system substrate-binding protein
MHLKKLAADWARISGGKVILKAYTGGRAGDESDMLRKIRLGQLHAAGLSVAGLSQIYPGVLALASPFLVQSDAELDYLFDRMEGHLDRAFEEKGYKILFWTTAGWAYFFSREPIITLADLKKQKLWVMTGNHEEMQAWKKHGFHPVMLSITDLMIQLQTGGVDAMVTSSLLAASNQWFGIANNRTNFRYAPFFGAFVISSKTWNRIPAQLRIELEKSARETAERMRVETLIADDEAGAVMEKYGLITHEVPEDIVNDWREFFDSTIPDLIGGRFDVEIYDVVKQHVLDFRRRNGE